MRRGGRGEEGEELRKKGGRKGTMGVTKVLE
jgi:hypothetical protein